MKAKVKFDKDSLIRFFTENGAKSVLGVVVLVFFMFVWSAIRTERYNKTPDDIKKVIESAQNHIKNADSKITGVIIPNYPKIIQYLNKPIPAEPYQLVSNWRSSIFPPLRERGQPTLERVEALVAMPGHGRFSDARTGGGGLLDHNNPLGRRWVILTGLFNMEKLRKSYKETFEDVALPPTTYEPEFYRDFCSFYVERAELTSENQNPETLKWKVLWDVAQYQPEQLGSPHGAQGPPVDPNCINPAIILPLPNRADRNWGEEVLHPEIPVIDSMAAKVAVPDGGTPPDIGILGFGVRPPRGNNVAVNAIPEKTSPYVLFRFIDLKVEPGRKYKYRVKLYLKNPNYELSQKQDYERYLDPGLVKIIQNPTPEQPWEPYIATEWSESNGVVHMPFDDNLLLTEVKSSTADAEPSATITAIHWDYMKGIEIFGDFEGILRGMVVDLLDQKMPTGEPGTPQPPEQQEEKVDYITGMLVLDLKGGGSLPGRLGLQKPSSMLLFSPGGSMIVQSSVTDKKERKKLENPQSGGAGRSRRWQPPMGRGHF